MNHMINDLPDNKTEIRTMQASQKLLILTKFSVQWLAHMREVLGWLEMSIKVRQNQLSAPKIQDKL